MFTSKKKAIRAARELRSNGNVVKVFVHDTLVEHPVDGFGSPPLLHRFHDSSGSANSRAGRVPRGRFQSLGSGLHRVRCCSDMREVPSVMSKRVFGRVFVGWLPTD